MDIVKNVLSYLSCAENGLTRSELTDVTSCNDELLLNAYPNNIPTILRSPSYLCTRILHKIGWSNSFNHVHSCLKQLLYILTWALVLNPESLLRSRGKSLLSYVKMENLKVNFNLLKLIATWPSYLLFNLSYISRRHDN